MQLNLSDNILCGVNWRTGEGTYTAEGITAIAEALKVTASVTSVDLSNNQLGPMGAKALVDGGAFNASVTECKLDGNYLGVEGWTIVFNTLRDSPASKITTWGLAGEHLGPEIAKPLAEYISVTASLTSLSLGQNELGDEGATVIARALKESKTSKLASLDLNGVISSNKIGPAAAKELAEYISVSASMTRLDVRCKSMLGEEGKAALRKAIEGRSGFELLL